MGGILKAAIYSLGCKVNIYESEYVENLLKKSGYQIVSFDSDDADVYIINTCSVTNEADRKSRKIINRAKKHNAIVVAMGCYTQVNPDSVSCDIVIGNKDKSRIVELINQVLDKKMPIKNIYDLRSDTGFEDMEITKFDNHTRAFVKIQDGCNAFCSYCIIPYARGRVRSRSQEEILEEISQLCENGCQEFVITGIHVTSYGVDIGNTSLIDLLEAISEISQVKRIRLGSLEPQIITDEFAKALSEIPQICAHFHLSLQSGCDATLKRMNRHYTAEEYKRGCDTLRRWFDHPALTTDVIVVFPGETDEEFEICKTFLEDISFAQMHIFKYSKRQGTRAAVMENQVDEQIKTKRSDILLALDAKLQQEYRDFWAERTMEVLLEEDVEIDGKTYMTGHSKEYIKVAVPKNNEKSNDVIKVKSIGQNSKEFMNCERMD